ncbi:MAG: hypothetical protein IT486_01540 [Gammaproteobacteria bacterium]|nr:hypothetical protein [Gammaproteobacteria bacterium]
MAYSTRGCRVAVVFIRWAGAALAAAGLAGCGGGGVGIGDGQGPDPVVLDIPIAYVKRPLPVDGQGALTADDARNLRRFDIGADLYVRDRAAPAAEERNVTGDMTQGLYDIRDLEPSYDGERVIFAMRGPFVEGADEEDQPKWGIWEYDLPADTLRRVITSDVTAALGHDVAPHYLPDGRIVFSSTRQRQTGAILVDEGKPQYPGLDENRDEPAFVLHVMDADGSNIHQISFNQSHDLDPTVTASGEIVFTRWDNAGGVDEMSLYRANPDGTGLQLLYGANSHQTGTNGATVQFLQPRELDDGRMLAVLRGFDAPLRGGNLILIDTARYVDDTQPLAADIGILTGPAQAAATVNDATTDDGISPNGLFAGAWPLHDGTGRVLVSWSQCRVLENGNPMPCTDARLAAPGAQSADPIYGIWIYDPADDTQLPVVAPDEGVLIADIVALEPRPLPPVIPDQENTGQLDPDLLAEGVGLLEIRSVYDFDGTVSLDIAATADPAQTTADARPARFLRLEKAVPIPDEDVRDFDPAAFGASAGQGMREVLGYTMVEPDGSVVVKVPANVPVAISVLDATGRRITARHLNWLQLRPGEVRSCNGCHDGGSGLSHGRDGVFNAAWAGATLDGQPFPNANPALFADMGETMAEARARISCATDCAAITPSVDLRFDDVWTDAVASGRAPDPSFAYVYADLATPAPTSAACQANWTALCRIIVNYESHVHPLWDVDRRVFDGGGALIADRTCTTCHNVVDAANAAQVPAGQLDLSDGLSDNRPAYFKSYAELLFGDNEQELNGGALQDRLVEVGIDPVTGDPILAPVPVGPVVSVAGALASGGFFNRFLAGGSHAGYLGGAELKLLAEWIDLGAQYYNDPFAAPLD